MPIILIKDADELTYQLASGSQPAFLTPREENFLVDGGFAEWTTEQPYTGNRMRCSWLGKPSAVKAGEGAQILVSTQVAAHTDKNGLWESNGTEWCRRALLPLAQVTAMGAGGVAAVNAAGQVVNKAGSPVSGGGGNTTVTLEHLPSTTAWAANLTPASYVSRFGFSTNVAIVVTVAGVTAPAANIQIQYSNDAGVSVASGPTTIGTITGNGTQTININPLTMPGAQFKVLINSGTGTGGTAGINVTLS